MYMNLSNYFFRTDSISVDLYHMQPAGTLFYT